MLLSSGRLQPVLKDFDVDRIVGGALVVRPYFRLNEAHAVQRLWRQAGASVGELLGIGVGAAEALNDAGVTADVPGRADVAGHIGPAYFDAIAGAKARAHGSHRARSAHLHSSR